MAEQDFQNMLKRQNPVRADDDPEGQNSNFTLLPKKMKIHCKQKEIAEKQDLIFSLLKRATQKVPNPNVQLELALLEETIQEVKTELNQTEGIHDSQPSISDHPTAGNAINSVSPVEGNSCELGKKSDREALQQAEEVIKHQRQQVALRESNARGDAQLMPSSSNIIQQESQVTSMSVVVQAGEKNTTVNNSTVNIVQIGEKAVDVDSPDFFEILKSLPLALQPSSNEEPALSKPKEMLPSSRGTAEVTTKRTQEHFRSRWQSQKKQYSTSVVHSHTVFQFLSEELSKRWRDVGRMLGLSEPTLFSITMDSPHDTQEAIYQMLLHWKQKEGSEATYNNLIRALQRVGRKDLADAMSKAYVEEM